MNNVEFTIFSAESNVTNKNVETCLTERSAFKGANMHNKFVNSH